MLNEYISLYIAIEMILESTLSHVTKFQSFSLSFFSWTNRYFVFSKKMSIVFIMYSSRHFHGLSRLQLFQGQDVHHVTSSWIYHFLLGMKSWTNYANLNDIL